MKILTQAGLILLEVESYFGVVSSRLCSFEGQQVVATILAYFSFVALAMVVADRLTAPAPEENFV